VAAVSDLVRNEPLRKIVPIAWVPGSIWRFALVPAFQAYGNSPHWHPVLADDTVVYTWPGVDDVEAAVLPYDIVSGGDEHWTLIWRTRRSGRILASRVEPQPPGGRWSNVFKPPAAAYNIPSRTLAAAAVIAGTAVFPAWDSDSPIFRYKIGAGDVKMRVESVEATGVTLVFELVPRSMVTRDGVDYVDEDAYNEFREFVERLRVPARPA